jgi:hypothetical protein
VSRINLLPDHFIVRQRRTRLATLVAVAAVFTVIAGSAWAAIARSQLGELSTRIASTQSRLAEEQQRSRAIEYRASESRSLHALLAHRSQLEPPVATAGVLTLLTHLLPDSVALTRLTLDVPAPDMTNRSAKTAGAPAPPAPQPTHVVLEGLALSDVELTQVVSALAGQKAFTNVKLVRSRQVPLGTATRFGFEITLDVPAAAAATTTAAAGKQAGGKGERGA